MLDFGSKIETLFDNPRVYKTEELRVGVRLEIDAELNILLIFVNLHGPLITAAGAPYNLDTIIEALVDLSVRIKDPSHISTIRKVSAELDILKVQNMPALKIIHAIVMHHFGLGKGINFFTGAMS